MIATIMSLLTQTHRESFLGQSGSFAREAEECWGKVSIECVQATFPYLLLTPALPNPVGMEQ